MSRAHDETGPAPVAQYGVGKSWGQKWALRLDLEGAPCFELGPRAAGPLPAGSQNDGGQPCVGGREHEVGSASVT